MTERQLPPRHPWDPRPRRRREGPLPASARFRRWAQAAAPQPARLHLRAFPDPASTLKVAVLRLDLMPRPVYDDWLARFDRIEGSPATCTTGWKSTRSPRRGRSDRGCTSRPRRRWRGPRNGTPPPAAAARNVSSPTWRTTPDDHPTRTHRMGSQPDHHRASEAAPRESGPAVLPAERQRRKTVTDDILDHIAEVRAVIERTRP